MPKIIKWTDGVQGTAMTRQEIIQDWLNDSEPESIHKPVCPECRTTLLKNDAGFYYCRNVYCSMPGEFHVVKKAVN
jgi:hypothetical protein